MNDSTEWSDFTLICITELSVIALIMLIGLPAYIIVWASSALLIKMLITYFITGIIIGLVEIYFWFVLLGDFEL